MQNIFIDTTNIGVQTHYSFKVILQEKVCVKKYFKLSQAVIPFDSLLMDDGNNKIIMNGTEITIPIGNYTLTQFLAKVNAVVSPTVPGFSATFSALLSLITMTATAAFSYKLNREFAQIIGFKNLENSGVASYTGQQTPIMSIPQVILLNVREIPDSRAAQANNYDVDFSFIILNGSNPGQNIQYVNAGGENTIEMEGDLRSISVDIYKNNGSYFRINSPVQLSFTYE